MPGTYPVMYSAGSQIIASSLILLGIAFLFGTMIVGPFRSLSPILRLFNPGLILKIEEESHRARISTDKHPISIYGHIFTILGLTLIFLGFAILLI